MQNINAIIAYLQRKTFTNIITFLKIKILKRKTIVIL